MAKSQEENSEHGSLTFQSKRWEHAMPMWWTWCVRQSFLAYLRFVDLSLTFDSRVPQAIAALIIDKVRGEGHLEDQCAWYGICYLVDTTLGLILAIWGLKILDYLAHENDWVALKHSGVYEGVDGVLHWIYQCLAWVFILTVVKIIIYYFMIWTSEPLAFVGGILFEPLQSNIRFELLFVMIFFPGLLNVIYFWIADSFLQAKAEHAGAHEDDPEETEMAQKKESLLTEEDKAKTEIPPIV